MASLVSSAPGRAADVAAQAHGAVALGDGRVRLGWARPQAAVADGGPGADVSPASAPGFVRPGTARAANPLQAEKAAFGDAYFARLVRLLLSEVITEAAAVQRQASGQSAAISDVAEREAAEISRRASAQIAAIREAAEREAAELRAAVMDLPAGTADAVSITEGLISPARPAAKPRTHPGTGSKGRQVRAMRKVVIALAALFLVGASSGAAEVALHGFSFFLFRNAGAGAGNSHDLNENQGPGQPDAPRAHEAHHEASPG